MMTHQKDKILHRMKIIKGHILAIEKMIEEDRYCIEVIHQSQAVQSALRKLDSLMLQDHIKNCVIEQAKSRDFKKISKELIKIYEFKQ